MADYLRLLRYARRQRGFLALILTLTLATAGLAALQPWPLNLLIDHVLGSVPLSAGLVRTFDFFHLAHDRTTLLLVIALGGLGLYLLNALADALLTWTWTLAGRRMVYAVAQDLMARLQRRSLAFHKAHSVGDLMSRVTVDSWCVYRLMDSLMFAPLYALLTMTAMVLFMAQLDLKLTLLAVAMAPVMVAGSLLAGKPLRAAARLKREIESRIQAHIQQTLTGIPVVQAFAQEEHESRRLEHFAEAAIRTQRRGALLGGINSLSSGLITTLASGIILWLGARDVLRGSLTVGGILVFLFYLNALKAQMNVLAGLYTKLQNIGASSSRVLEMLANPPDLVEQPDAIPLSQAAGKIQFQDVTAGYEPGHPILHHVSFEVPAGQAVAIVGATGAGKTTLANLVPRFADPWEGRVKLDGRDLRDYRLADLRGQIAVVLQEPFLFPVSVAENIAYGRPEATREEIQAAAQAANAHAFITALPQGYDTVIGERGATLSGGERQRLSIARALLKNAAILILDEPTSALDAETERLILEALHRLMQGRTTLIISHRFSLVTGVNQVVVLKDGQLIEQGAPQELLRRNGPYARLHRLQTEAPPPAVTN